MYQYRGCRLDYTDSAISIRDSNGTFIGYCENDAEATSYIDGYLDDPVGSNTTVDIEIYYIYRIRKGDKDCYGNYQYYNGRCFRYGATVKKMTKSRAESIIARYLKWDDEYNYHIGK